MRGGFSIIVAVFLLLSLLATGAHAKETVAIPPGLVSPTDPGNFYGQEIQKVVDYLRSIGMNNDANNTELFLKAGKFIIKPGLKEEEEANAMNTRRGGPIYIDPSAFQKNGFDTTNSNHVAEMMVLAQRLIHEKFHSEVHDAFARVSQNIKGKLGWNHMEIHGWSRGLNFLEGVIKYVLDMANDKKRSKEERKNLLIVAQKLYDNKIILEKTYESNEYGPPLHPIPGLRKLKDNVTELLKKLENNETVDVGSLIDSHNKFDEEVGEQYATYMENYRSAVESDSQEFALKMIKIAAVVKNRQVDEPLKLYLVLNSDIPSDMETGSREFLLNYRPQQKIKISGGAKPEYADYTLTISQSVFTQIYSDKDPAGKAKELFNQGKFSVVELESEQAVIEKELDTLLVAYKNVEKIPSSVRSLVKNERVNFVIDIGDGKKITRGMVFSDAGLESVKGGLSDPAIEFRTTKNVLKKIRDAPVTQAAVTQALNDGSIEYKALETGSSIRLFGARAVSKLAGLINKGTFRVNYGEKKPIVYAGQEAMLEGYPNGLNVVVIPGKRDFPVVNRFGFALGFINSKIQTFMMQQPQAYSRNAGVYQYGVTTYENHWQNVDYEPLVPTFATSHSSRELMASAYNGRTYARVGGLT